ncbi:MAG: class I SAM-dependent methyltransferase [Planctomycetota bacterium]
MTHVPEPTPTPELSKYDFYERCVQSPEDLAPLLRAIHGQDPEILGEDFCAAAALSKAWCAREGSRAIGVDLDPEPLERARREAPSSLELIQGDALNATDQPADVIFVGNFSIGEIHERERLMRYLRHCHARLREGGVFVCDTYGGEGSFTQGAVHRNHPGPDGATIRYTWEQRAADPLTGRVVNALHFRLDEAGMITQELTDAFVYDWRLRSVPELRDAMREAGFARTEVYAKLADAVDTEGNAYVRPVEDADELEESYIVLVVGRI